MKRYLIAYVLYVTIDILPNGAHVVTQSREIRTTVVEGNSSQEVYETFKKENTDIEIIAVSYIGD